MNGNLLDRRLEAVEADGHVWAAREGAAEEAEMQLRGNVGTGDVAVQTLSGREVLIFSAGVAPEADAGAASVDRNASSRRRVQAGGNQRRQKRIQSKALELAWSRHLISRKSIFVSCVSARLAARSLCSYFASR